MSDPNSPAGSETKKAFGTTPIETELRTQLSDPQFTHSETLRDFIKEKRTQLRRMHEGGASGSALVRHWSDTMEKVVCSLFSVLTEHKPAQDLRFALFGLGGFGRSELSPRSDLDLLVLHNGKGEIESLVQGLSYPLWDAGLDVQCFARTIEENIVLARQDVRSRSNLLESRFLCGDPELCEKFNKDVIADEILNRGVLNFLQAMVEEMRSRHERFGQTVYLLQPQVKEGEGGLRDIQMALAVAKTRFRVRSPGGLVQKGLVPASEVEALQNARDFLLRIRNHLHFVCDRKEDRLSFELQDEIAEFLGYTDSGRTLGAERLLQQYYDCANQVRHFARSLIRRSMAGQATSAPDAAGTQELSRGIYLQGGEIQLDKSAVTENPLLMMGAFEAAQARHAELSPQALQIIRDHLPLIDDRFRRDPDAVRMFLGILQSPRRVASTLVAMHDVRFLDRFIPEMSRVFGRVQRDLYHAYPVDVHSLFAVQELRRLARGEYEVEFPLYTQVMRELKRPHILYLATLLHDVGKGEGHDHEQIGAELAIQVADRMDLPPIDREYLEFLVRQHLLLPHIAQSRDLQDEQLILDFAQQIGDIEALKMLHLLSFADARAVGPGGWTAWKHSLFREVYEKTHEALEHGHISKGKTADRVQVVTERFRRAAREMAPVEEVEEFLGSIDQSRYLTANPVEVLLRHLAVFMGRSRAPVIELRAVPTEGYTEVLLLTRDHPGLFAQVAGLMAAHNINILSAILNTRRDGWVLDVFHVSVPSGEPMASGQRWEDWRRDLLSVLKNQRSLREILGSRLQPRLTLAMPKTPAEVRIDNDASQHFTVIDVSAGDRLGLLYELTEALAESNLSIHLAKIVTTLHRVADSFYVESIDGGKLIDPLALQQLRERLETIASESQKNGGTVQ